MKKKCTKCAEEKDVDEFGKNKKGKGGLQPWCKSCINKRAKEYHKRDYAKERKKKYFKEYSSNPFYNKRRSEWAKNYYSKHPEKQKARCSTLYAIQRYYRYNAKKKGLEYSISTEKFISFKGKPCHYCGEVLDRPRIDRVDSNIGYTEENTVPCCSRCNYAKLNFSKEDFLLWVKKVYAYNFE